MTYRTDGRVFSFAGSSNYSVDLRGLLSLPRNISIRNGSRNLELGIIVYLIQAQDEAAEGEQSGQRDRSLREGRVSGD